MGYFTGLKPIGYSDLLILAVRIRSIILGYSHNVHVHLYEDIKTHYLFLDLIFLRNFIVSDLSFPGH